MFLSNVKFLVKSTISSTQGTWTTFNISEDFETGTHIESTSPLSIVLKNQTQIERMTITSTWWVATIIKRGLTQADTKVEDSNLKRIWNDWTIGYVTALASDLLDIDKEWGVVEINNDISFKWDLKFEWEVEFSDSVEINNTLRIPTFNNTGARDAVFTSPENWNSCFVIWIWQMIYSSWVWQPLLEWLPTPNASTTVSWKVEIATNAEMDNGTNIWGTGAFLTPTPSQFKRKEFVEGFNVGWLTETTTLTETDEFLLNQGWNKKITTDNLLRANKEVFVAWENITAWNALYIHTDWKVYKTDASNSSKINFIWFATNTATTWNNVLVDTSWVSATQSGLTIWSDYYLSNTPWAISTTPWTNIVNVWKAVSATWIQINIEKPSSYLASNTIISQGVAIYWTWTSYTKVREFKIRSWWTFRIFITFASTNPSYTARARIYKNWVAFWTERQVTWTTQTSFTEDLSFNTWDLCQLYVYQPNDWWVNVTNIALWWYDAYWTTPYQL